jgi:hypothetical protein
MSVSIPERPGAIRDLYRMIYPRNITEFSYRWSDPDYADVVISLQTLKGKNVEEDKELVIDSLQDRGYKVLDFSDNELAKAHIRHLAGGRPGRDLYLAKDRQTSSSSSSAFASGGCPSAEDRLLEASASFAGSLDEEAASAEIARAAEASGTDTFVGSAFSGAAAAEGASTGAAGRMNTCAVSGAELVEKIYRFEFPEHPGALGKFFFILTDFSQDWNISLFHYRNHGHDYGRVLVGLLVRKDEVGDLQDFISALSYRHYDETDNVAFKHFLK